ncbi:hypothetical protein F4820DRAFT_402788 [Hypoxylon rubiginosum]|uniref:Uncharacterized protein n=1 Tax=Hypoxylon rubiginosum TaxID=110542 RepID=A0ACB9ZFU6_9PEZI|nr:hypothetical protein F4820DRAFT_402788 [Hypoxylon rubiginosum]
MSWDSKSATRRRQNSSISSPRSLPHHARQQSKQPAQPRSPHVTDPFLQSFLAPSFDAADYLNASLPPLQTSATAITRAGDGAVPLAELSTQAQTQLSQLNAHTTRLTNTLTQLTDDILRSGSRLAYEVELLRGETLSLSEALSDGLHDEIVKFVPDGIQEQTGAKASGTSHAQRRLSEAVAPPSLESKPRDTTSQDPQYISQLQTLVLVRAQLDTVVKTFGEAMEFVFPPSELSVSSSFLSVSAPEPGVEAHSTEEKGQQVLRQLKEEISDLLMKSSDPVEGIEKAAHRIEELKQLTKVWKGTAEEKGRTKFIDGLAKMVEDRHKELIRETEQSGRRDGKADLDSSPRKAAAGPDRGGTESKPLYGIMSQLQRLRAGLQ